MHLQILIEADLHVAEWAARIIRQEALIASLDRDGHDTTEANRLLSNFRAARAQHAEHRDRFLKRARELWELEGRPAGRDLEFWLRAKAEINDEFSGVSRPSVNKLAG
jgi:hypothetical protein